MWYAQRTGTPWKAGKGDKTEWLMMNIPVLLSPTPGPIITSPTLLYMPQEVYDPCLEGRAKEG